MYYPRIRPVPGDNAPECALDGYLKGPVTVEYRHQPDRMSGVTIPEVRL